MFPMAHSYGDHKLRNVNVISYNMIKLSKCGGLHNKAIEQWHIKTKKDKNIWANFRQQLIAEYEKLLAEG